MKKLWYWFINLSLLVVGISFLIKWANNIIHHNITSLYSANPNSAFSRGFDIGYTLGFYVGYFGRLAVAIAFLYLFYERVFKNPINR